MFLNGRPMNSGELFSPSTMIEEDNVHRNPVVPIASPTTPLSLRRPRRKRKKKVDETAVDLADLDAFLEEAEKVPVAEKPVYEENRYINYNEEDVPECDFLVKFKKEELEENHWTLELEEKAMSLYEAKHSFMAISYFCKLSVNKVRSKIEALTCKGVPKRQPARLRAGWSTPLKRKIGHSRSPRKRKREDDEESQPPKAKPEMETVEYNELMENPFVQCRISPTLSEPIQQENPFESSSPVEFGVPWTPEPEMRPKPQINEFYDGVFLHESGMWIGEVEVNGVRQMLCSGSDQHKVAEELRYVCRKLRAEGKAVGLHGTTKDFSLVYGLEERPTQSFGFSSISSK